MIILNKPYVSDFLIETIKKNGFKVLDNEIARNYFNKEELLSSDEAIRNNDLIYSNSENSIDWVVENLKNSDISRMIKISKDKVLFSAVKSKMRGKGGDPCIYTSESRSQRASMVLKNVKYGIEFHFELTGLKNDNETDAENKHYNIIKRRLEKGQWFRTPCLGCSEFPVKRLELVEEFDSRLISRSILDMGDVDFGYMCYRVEFEDGGKPINDDWENPKFSDRATTIYYRPHMIGGVIDVKKYREDLIC